MHIQAKNIHKSYGSIHANEDITLEIKPGVIMGLLGENGAGKSTFVKVLAGTIEMDSGNIEINGLPASIHSPSDAISLGIGLLHQDTCDFPTMGISENLQVGVPKKFFNSKQRWKEFAELQSGLGFHINLYQKIGDLTLGERQQLELLRLLWNGANLLILDEPTTGISRHQKQLLFAALRKLVEDGKNIIFVSHKLEDIQELCSRVAILRKGKLVGTLDVPCSDDDLVEMMFGRKLIRHNPCRNPSTESCLKIEGLAIKTSKERFFDIDLQIQRGEVIGLAGMEGSGQNHFLRVLAGLSNPIQGTISLNSHTYRRWLCFQMQREGIFFVPAGRLEDALLPGLTLQEHFYLSTRNVPFLIKKKKIVSSANEAIAQFNIKGQPSSFVEELSGGNQQRLVLAMQKKDSRLMLLEYPTRGLDIESANWVWEILRGRCEMGTSIIFSSQDLDELLFYADRIIVFYGNRVSKPIQASNMDENLLGSMIGGKNWEEAV